jgi:hypothetical protein
VLEVIGQAKHLQLTSRYCGEERVRSVFRRDPNERPEPSPLAFFDLAHGLVMFALVDSFGFSESVFQFGGIEVEGVDDSLKAASRSAASDFICAVR